MDRAVCGERAFCRGFHRLLDLADFRIFLPLTTFLSLAAQARYFEIFNEEVRADALEARVLSDISDTLHLFNFLIPNILRGAWTLFVSARELYAQRARIDAPSLLRPTVVGLLNELVAWARTRYVTDTQVRRRAMRCAAVRCDAMRCNAARVRVWLRFLAPFRV